VEESGLGLWIEVVAREVTLPDMLGMVQFDAEVPAESTPLFQLT
jgi:hypothetical protein